MPIPMTAPDALPSRDFTTAVAICVGIAAALGLGWRAPAAVPAPVAAVAPAAEAVVDAAFSLDTAMRLAGTQARQIMILAAAEKWGVPAAQLEAQINAETGRVLAKDGAGDIDQLVITRDDKAYVGGRHGIRSGGQRRFSLSPCHRMLRLGGQHRRFAAQQREAR
mgnify:CR=1 FL=1